MALPIRSLLVFSGVALLAGLFAASSLSMTAGMVSTVAENAPVMAKPTKPSYIARMPVVTAEALNVAKSVPVKPVVQSVTVLQPPVASSSVAELQVEATPSFAYQVAATGANVRSGPQKSFPTVFTLSNGSWVNISENVSGWVKVTDEAGREGWVYGTLLTPAPTEVAAAAD
jgi:uncharacterized protein YgiM (DUF1202 family)